MAKDSVNCWLPALVGWLVVAARPRKPKRHTPSVAHLCEPIIILGVPDDESIEIEFAPDGRLVDFLDDVLLEDRPEERVRQQFLRILHFEYGYPKDVMRREVTIMAGSSPALRLSRSVLK